MVEFTKNSRYRDWLDFVQERGPVDDDPETCSVWNWANSIGDITVEEGSRQTLDRAIEGNENAYRAAVWTLVHGLDKWPADLRDDIIRAVATEGPRASYVYGMVHTALTPSERMILWRAFESMPTTLERMIETYGDPNA